MKTPVQIAIEQFDHLRAPTYADVRDDVARELIEKCPASMRHGLRLLWAAIRDE